MATNKDFVVLDRDAFKKNNDLIAMVPLGSLDPIARKLYNAILKETLRQSLQVKAETGSWPLGNHDFVAPLADLLEAVGFRQGNDSGDVYARATKWLKQMKTTQVDWTPTEKGVEVKYKNIEMLSQVVLYKKGRNHFVEWALPTKIVDRVWNLDSFTILNLSQLVKLKTYSSLALYEIFSRYRNIHSTAAHSTDWWASVILPNPSSNREWRKLKNEHVTRAVKEINELTDLVVEGPIEKREAGARSQVVSVYFNVKPKQRMAVEVAEPDLFQQSVISAETSLLAARQKVSTNTVKKIIREYPEKGDVIAQAALEKMAPRAGSIETPDRYFLSTARDIAALDPSSTTPAPMPSKAAKAQAPSESDLKLSAAKERMLSLPAEELSSLVNRAFDKLPPAAIRPVLLRQMDAFKSDRAKIPAMLVAHALAIFIEGTEGQPG